MKNFELSKRLSAIAGCAISTGLGMIVLQLILSVVSSDPNNVSNAGDMVQGFIRGTMIGGGVGIFAAIFERGRFWNEESVFTGFALAALGLVTMAAIGTLASSPVAAIFLSTVIVFAFGYCVSGFGYRRGIKVYEFFAKDLF